ncbi:hypothetical protein [Arthrobacter sp. AQ5-05]|uniref:hypothetical protein n=1 Tax=Arthrobacter sp. AQ5-05 TaxID=2184581 RepID=UPI0015EC077D|nr:hypothetical protein [Arthrobacter sp. AQ5-05]
MIGNLRARFIGTGLVQPAGRGLLEFPIPGVRVHLRGAQDRTSPGVVLSAEEHNGQDFEVQGNEHDGYWVHCGGVFVSSFSCTVDPGVHGPIRDAALEELEDPMTGPWNPATARPPQKETSLHPASGRSGRRQWYSMVIDLTFKCA